MQLKSLRLYILFRVALGQTEGCVLYKAESRARDFSPARSFFSPKLVASYPQVTRKLNHAEKLEHRHDDTRAVKPEHIKQIKKDSCYHHSASSSVPGSSIAEPCSCRYLSAVCAASVKLLFFQYAEIPTSTENTMLTIVYISSFLRLYCF